MSKKQASSRKFSYSRQRSPLGNASAKNDASPSSSRSPASAMNDSIRSPVLAPTYEGSNSSQWVMPSSQRRRSVVSPTPRTGMKLFSIRTYHPR